MAYIAKKLFFLLFAVSFALVSFSAEDDIFLGTFSLSGRAFVRIGLALREEYLPDKQAHNSGKVMHYTPHTQKECDKGLCRLFVEDCTESAVITHVVEYKICNYKYHNGDYKRAQCQNIAFLSHFYSSYSKITFIL